MALFDFLKRDPIREVAREARQLVQIPIELVASTAESASKALEVVAKAGLATPSAERAVLQEICAYHFTATVIAMSNARDPSGRITHDTWNRDATFLIKTVNQLLADAEFRGLPDIQMLRTMVEQDTVDLAVAYFTRNQTVLQTTDRDVTELAEYDPRLLSVTRRDFSSTVFCFIVRAVRAAGLESLRPGEFKTAAIATFVGHILKGVMELEQKVMRSTPR
jgi:hypothetical protein